MGRLFQLDEEPIKILALIGGQLRRLFSAKLIKEAGAAGGPQAILNNLKLTSQYQAKLLIGTARNLPTVGTGTA
jgi:DNA polymerase III delta subunit